MSADVEAPPRDLELSSLEAEKQPMASADAGPEKNGLMKASDPTSGAAAAPKFTGLGKEELLRAAAAPGWVRARTALLAVFWLGWLGMLGAAAAIVARAPRCDGSAAERRWWNEAGIYRATPEAFGGSGSELRAHLDYVAALAGGLLLGPLPQHSAGDPPLKDWPPQMGGEEELLQAARERGLRVLVELTPNAMHPRPWGGATPSTYSDVKEAIGAWLQRGFDGVFLDSIEELESDVLSEFLNVTEQWSTEGTPRLLLGGTRLRDPPALRSLLNSTKVPLVLGVLPLSPPPDPKNGPESLLEPQHLRQLLQLSRGGAPIVWSVGTPWQRVVGLSPPLAPQVLLLLWGGLPTAPTLNYGDEVGLTHSTPTPGNEQLTPMPWDEVEALQEGGNSSQAQLLSLCRRLRALRGEEPALAVGGAELLWAEPRRGVAILRGGGAEGGERFLLLLNPWGEGHVTPAAPLPPSEPSPPPSAHPPLPPDAVVVLGTHRSPPPPPGTGSSVRLAELRLAPHEAVLLRLPPPA